MKIVLAGSPEISVPAFKNVINNFDVVAIVTQPDKPKGRGMKLTETPVAKLGREENIKVFKPSNIGDITKELSELDFDLFLTFAFGQYIPTKILSIGKLKPLNIHGSLLPKYRGAAPIQAAILNGDNEIGITLIEMVKKMDAGDMLFNASKEISNFSTTGDGFKIISDLAKDNIVQWLDKVFNGDVKPVKQPTNFSTQEKIEKSFAELDSKLSMYDAERKIRGLSPFPGAFIFIKNKRLKIFNVSRERTPNCIELSFSDGILFANDFQWEGKKRTLTK